MLWLIRSFTRRVPRLLAASAAVALQACSSAGQAPADAGADRAPDGGSAELFALSVRQTNIDASPGAVAVELVPSFSPGVHDYYVRCGAGANDLTVSVTASAGSMSMLTQPLQTAEQPSQDVAIRIYENDAIVAVATNSGAAAEYWVRCLPHDFPPMKMDLQAGADRAPPGYYLVGTEANKGNGYGIVLNGDGVPVWYVSSGVLRQEVEDFDILPNGSVGYTQGYLQDLPIAVIQFAPISRSTVAPRGYALDTHEIQVLPNGNFLAISSPTVKDVDLTGLRKDLPDGGTMAYGPGSTILGCLVLEFEPATGKVVWTWDASDHFDPARDAVDFTVSNLTTSSGAPILEVYHCNSIDIDPENGNLLVSSRDMDSVFYVERPSGKVLWKLGGAPYTKDGAAFVPASDPFYQQHDGRLQRGWSAACGTGQVSVFDDHTSQPGVARALLLDVVTAAPLPVTDGGAAPECGASAKGPPSSKVVWQYRGQRQSGARGSFRILPDGSRVIGWGSGKGGSKGLQVFTEVDERGYDLRDFYYTDGQTSYRAIKVPLDTFDLGTLRRTAGLP